nr:MAG TPA: hypothetical protein [Caudoviricetes sp.]
MMYGLLLNYPSGSNPDAAIFFCQTLTKKGRR